MFDGRELSLDMYGNEPMTIEWFEKQCGKGVVKMTKKITIDEFIETEKVNTILDDVEEKNNG